MKKWYTIRVITHDGGFMKREFIDDILETDYNFDL